MPEYIPAVSILNTFAPPATNDKTFVPIQPIPVSTSALFGTRVGFVEVAASSNIAGPAALSK